jgi:choline dehydrogenase-like flavoprotein
MATHYDAVVIGSGQGGGPLAQAFAKAGKKTALIEATHVGGTCVNEGKLHPYVEPDAILMLVQDVRLRRQWSRLLG